MHYRGYSSDFDEWKEKTEVVLNKPKFETTEREWSSVTELACAIKKTSTSKQIRRSRGQNTDTM